MVSPTKKKTRQSIEKQRGLRGVLRGTSWNPKSQVFFPKKVTESLKSAPGGQRPKTSPDPFLGLPDQLRSTLKLIATAEEVDRLESPLSKPIILARREALRASNQEMLLYLLKLFTVDQIEYMTFVEDKHAIERTAREGISHLQPDTEQRLRTAYEIAQMLASQYDSQYIARWFYRMDPQLNNHGPVEAIRQGQLREALSAAQVFIVSG